MLQAGKEAGVRNTRGKKSLKTMSRSELTKSQVLFKDKKEEILVDVKEISQEIATERKPSRIPSIARTQSKVLHPAKSMTFIDLKLP